MTPDAEERCWCGDPQTGGPLFPCGHESHDPHECVFKYHHPFQSARVSDADGENPNSPGPTVRIARAKAEVRTACTSGDGVPGAAETTRADNPTPSPASASSEECEARKEDTTGLRSHVWDELDGEIPADLGRCDACGHQYFSDDNFEPVKVDPQAVEYAEHSNHAHRLLSALRERVRVLEVGMEGFLGHAERFHGCSHVASIREARAALSKAAPGSGGT